MCVGRLPTALEHVEGVGPQGPLSRQRVDEQSVDLRIGPALEEGQGTAVRGERRLPHREGQHHVVVLASVEGLKVGIDGRLVASCVAVEASEAAVLDR